MTPRRTTVSGVTELVIRDAELADVDAIVDVVTRAYRGGEGEAGWTTESQFLGGQRTDPAEVSAGVADPNGRLLVATDHDGNLIGCIKIDRVGDGVHFGLFAVDPSIQGSGAGNALLAAVDAQAREWGCVWIGMEVLNLRHDIKAWYERKGFRPTGEVIAFPYGDERFGVPLRDDLHFDGYRKALS